MKTVAYRCPRCEQPFTFASPSAARQNLNMPDARADDMSFGHFMFAEVVGSTSVILKRL